MIANVVFLDCNRVGIHEIPVEGDIESALKELAEKHLGAAMIAIHDRSSRGYGKNRLFGRWISKKHEIFRVDSDTIQVFRRS